MSIEHENKVIEKLLIEKDELLYLALKQLGLID